MQCRMHIILNFIIVHIYVRTTTCNRPLRKDNVSFPDVHMESKIVGGTPVDIDKFPSSVQLLNFGSLCSGTIINSWAVLTAAHCFDLNKNVNDMVIDVGSRYVFDFNADSYDVLYFVVHQAYNKSVPFACDIALVFVDGPITFGNKSKKAPLVNSNKWMNVNEGRFVATGWGWIKYGGPISEHGLMMTRLRFVTLLECSRLHQIEMTQDMFCLYGDGERDTCKGDSGGGVLWNGMLVGIVSHGDGCAKKDKPSVYTNVYNFRNWIKQNVMKFYHRYCQKRLHLSNDKIEKLKHHRSKKKPS